MFELAIEPAVQCNLICWLMERVCSIVTTMSSMATVLRGARVRAPAGELRRIPASEAAPGQVQKQHHLCVTAARTPCYSAFKNS